MADFETQNKLGSGSFGTVYKVRRKADNSIYVIKDVRIGELSFREQAEAINEVNILAGIDSPYIVGYFDSFIEAGSLHIVMEYCNRGDLQALVKKAKAKDIACLKEDVTWNLGLQVILGLHYLHEKRILHRDLKSANVFLQKDSTQKYFGVKIGDLGVAKLLESTTAFAKTIVGTPYYLSPELVADQPYRDKSDCWALGVLLYECCTLCHPFEARNQCALIMKIMQAPVKPPPEATVSPQLCKLILWLLQKDPSNRPHIRDILLDGYVGQKLADHGFALPHELRGLDSTSFLSSSEPVAAGDIRYKIAGLGGSSSNLKTGNDGSSAGSGSGDATSSRDWLQQSKSPVKAGGSIGTEARRGAEVPSSSAGEDDVGRRTYLSHDVNPDDETVRVRVTARTGAVPDAKACRDGNGNGNGDDYDDWAGVKKDGSRNAGNARSNMEYGRQVAAVASSHHGAATAIAAAATATHQRSSTGGPPIKPLRSHPTRMHGNGNPVRGDRVRGGVHAQRVTSSRVLSRHQVAPALAPAATAAVVAAPAAAVVAANLNRSMATSDRMSNSTALDDIQRGGSVPLAEPGTLTADADSKNGYEVIENKLSSKDVGDVLSMQHSAQSKESHPDHFKRSFKAAADGNSASIAAAVSNSYSLAGSGSGRRQQASHSSVSPSPAEQKGSAAEEPVVATVDVGNGLGMAVIDDDDDYHDDNSDPRGVNLVRGQQIGGERSGEQQGGLLKRHESESADDVSTSIYDSDFEDYDEELADLYQQPSPRAQNDQRAGKERVPAEYRQDDGYSDEEYADDDVGVYDDPEADEPEQDGPLSAEYLAYYGKVPNARMGASKLSAHSGRVVPHVAPSKANSLAGSGSVPGSADVGQAQSREPADDFKASLRREASMKLEGKGIENTDAAASFRIATDQNEYYGYGAGAGAGNYSSGVAANQYEVEDEGEGEDEENMSYDSLDVDDTVDPDELRLQLDEMLYWITDTRELLIKNLGEEIFREIYHLCKVNMKIGPSAAAVAAHSDSSYLHDIQRKLQEHLNATLEAVLGTVMQVKALLAWEEELSRKNITQSAAAADFLQGF